MSDNVVIIAVVDVVVVAVELEHPMNKNVTFISNFYEDATTTTTTTQRIHCLYYWKKSFVC
jgi:hypothetical protein